MQRNHGSPGLWKTRCFVVHRHAPSNKSFVSGWSDAQTRFAEVQVMGLGPRGGGGPRVRLWPDGVGGWLSHFDNRGQLL